MDNLCTESGKTCQERRQDPTISSFRASGSLLGKLSGRFRLGGLTRQLGCYQVADHPSCTARRARLPFLIRRYVSNRIRQCETVKIKQIGPFVSRRIVMGRTSSMDASTAPEAIVRLVQGAQPNDLT